MTSQVNAIGSSRIWIKPGTAAYRRIGVAFFLSGFASFSLIYCAQPILPELARSFSVNPANSSLALSSTTAMLAVSILINAAVSQAIGRRGVMFASMAAGVVAQFVAASAPTWETLVIARALEGLAMGGVPAVAMAYLAEEIDPAHLGETTGLYFGGMAFGAMAGRVGVGLLADLTNWRIAMITLGVLCSMSAAGFLAFAPRSRNFVPRPDLSPMTHLRAWGECLRRPALARVYGIGFCLSSAFVTLFNYAAFRLAAPPYGLSGSQVSMIFLTYGMGVASSSITGGIADRVGRKMPLLVALSVMAVGIVVTLIPTLSGSVIGISIVTAGFFVAHSMAGGAVGPLAGAIRGHAASLYLLFFYTGSSVVGWAGGWFWQHGGWPAVAALTTFFCALGLGLAAFPDGTRRA